MIDLIAHIFGVISESFSLLSAMSPYLLVGFGVAGLLHSFIPSDKVYRHLGGGGVVPLIKAVLFGVPLPLCSCGVIPVATSLRRDGASKAATLSFLVATPTTGADSILATLALMGPLFAIFRPIAAALAGLTVGLVAIPILHGENTHRHDEVIDLIKDKEKRGFIRKLLESIEYGYGELVEDIGKTLLWAVILGGAIAYFMPAPLVERYLGNPVVSFLVMLAIAVPMYVCATGSIPIAAALIAKGMNPGAALVFLIAGPATNTVTIAVVSQKLGKKAAVLYVIAIVIVAIAMGAAFNWVWHTLGSSQKLIAPIHQATGGWIGPASAIALILLILRGLVFKHEHGDETGKGMEGVRLKFSVPDISCRHCQATVERAVSSVDGVEKVFVDLDEKSVFIGGDASAEAIADAIREAGYTPQSVEEIE